MTKNISRRELYEYAYNNNMVFRPEFIDANSKKATRHFVNKLEIDCNESNENPIQRKIYLIFY